MVAFAEQFRKDELIRKIWGKYLHDEYKFDKWGAQGKILVIVEVMREEGIDAESQSSDQLDYQEIVNELFPRTFYCERHRLISASIAKAIARYFSTLQQSLSESGLTGMVLYETCEQETAEKFCIPVNEVRKITNPAANNPL